MVFASITFLWIFLPIILVLYYILRAAGKEQSKNFLLLIVSLLFYAYGEPKMIVVMLLCVLINYVGGICISGSEGRMKSTALACTVILNLGILAYYKYFNFLSGILTATLGRISGHIFPAENIVLPIGISFYTFQAMSYTIDLYRGRCRVQKSFWKLLLYISFFPQLIAGPIVRYRDISNQIDHREEGMEKLAEGISRFITGLGKKVLLANAFAVRADFIFTMPDTERGAALAWVGVLLYTLQIYYDFSGYSDMAIGMGKMFGFDFLENFNLPYTAASVTEFWRRWHISLSSWFREYLYIPLGGNRRGKIHTCLNLLAVFFLTGLWHGAGWNFIIWGLVHGVLVIAERILNTIRDQGRYSAVFHKTGWLAVFSHVYTLLAVALAWILFRADSLTAAIGYFRTLITAGGSAWGVAEIIGIRGTFLLAAGILFAGALPGQTQSVIRRAPVSQAVIQPAVLLLCILYLVSDSYNPFIYFRF